MTRWGVGRYDGPDGPVTWEIEDDEIRRDMGAATRTLGALGIGAGDRVVFCSMLSEAGQWWPLIVGAMLVGAQLSCADSTAGEAARVAMFCRQLAPRAVLGVTPAILDGLHERGDDLAAVLGGVEVLGARPGAHERLEAAGLSPRWCTCAGPAVVAAREPGGPAYADGEEWRLEPAADGSGRVAVTSLQPRATTFARTPTALRGSIAPDGAVVPVPIPPVHR